MARASLRRCEPVAQGAVGVYPGFSLHEELALLVRDARLTPRGALCNATVGPARFFGLEREAGAVAAGMLADLVLLDADPLADIGDTRRIRAVVASRRLLDRAALDALLADAARRAAEGRATAGAR